MSVVAIPARLRCVIVLGRTCQDFFSDCVSAEMLEASAAVVSVTKSFHWLLKIHFILTNLPHNSRM